MLVAQLRLTLWDPMDCSPPGSSVHGILQARILEWVAMPFSSISFQLRDQIEPRSSALQILYHLNHNNKEILLPNFPDSFASKTAMKLSLGQWYWREFWELFGCIFSIGFIRNTASTCFNRRKWSVVVKMVEVSDKRRIE